MRILLVSHGYPPFGVAGVERITEQTAAELTKAGHRVTVLSRRLTGAPALPRLEAPRQANGVEVRLVAGGAGEIGAFPAHQDRMERIFERVLLEVLPDVVVIGHLMGQSPGYVALAHRWRVPVVVELHDFYTVCERAHLERVNGDLCHGPEGGRACAAHCFADQPDAVGRWALRTHVFGLALREADALLCPSQFVADYFLAAGVDAQRLHVMPNGIGFPTVAPRSRRPPNENRDREPLRLASLAIVTPHKGAHIVVEALRKARLPAVRYTLFGAVTQPYARSLRERAVHIDGLQLQMYGPYDPVSLPGLLQGIDAVVIPSLVWETFSIVAREAFACGVPVIASRMGALPEAVRQGDNGLLFDPNGSAELAHILQTLDADRTHLRRLRDGIRPADWIGASERARRLEAVLVHLRANASRRSATTTIGHADLSALRSLV